MKPRMCTQYDAYPLPTHTLLPHTPSSHTHPLPTHPLPTHTLLPHTPPSHTHPSHTHPPPHPSFLSPFSVRVVTFIVVDSLGAQSDPARARVNFEHLDNPPILDLNGVTVPGNNFTTQFREGDSLIAVSAIFESTPPEVAIDTD